MLPKKDHREPFSCENQPHARMKIKTKCERVQPFVVGRTKTGELKWEGREMPRWQMELIRVSVNWFGEFFVRWLETAKYETKHEDFDDTKSVLTHWIVASKQRLEEIRRQFPNKYPRRSEGD